MPFEMTLAPHAKYGLTGFDKTWDAKVHLINDSFGWPSSNDPLCKLANSHSGKDGLQKAYAFGEAVPPESS